MSLVPGLPVLLSFKLPSLSLSEVKCVKTSNTRDTLKPRALCRCPSVGEGSPGPRAMAVSSTHECPVYQKIQWRQKLSRGNPPLSCPAPCVSVWLRNTFVTEMTTAPTSLTRIPMLGFLTQFSKAVGVSLGKLYHASAVPEVFWQIAVLLNSQSLLERVAALDQQVPGEDCGLQVLDLDFTLRIPLPTSLCSHV